MFKWIWPALLDLVYPPAQACPLCGKFLSRGQPGKIVCVRCAADIKAYRLQEICTRCGRFAPEGAEPGAQEATGGQFYCETCKADPPQFTQARALGLYDGLLREAIHAFKYRGQVTLAASLGKLLAEVIKAEFGREPALVVPVPLHARRAFERGFNQAELLAEVVAQELNWEVGRGVLLRVVYTSPQARLGQQARLWNIPAGVFQVPCKEAVAGHAILLIDDVMTSGATCEACAHALKQAGSGPVLVATVATGRILTRL